MYFIKDKNLVLEICICVILVIWVLIKVKFVEKKED